MNKVDEKYLKDYEYFVKNRLLPLIGIDYNIVDADRIYMAAFAKYENGILYLGNNSQCIIEIADNDNKFIEDDLGLVINIMEAYSKVSRYSPKGNVKNMYNSNEQFHLITDNALQVGIANWIMGNKASDNNVEQLLNVLDEWKLKTYEGKSVTFNFKVINSNESPKLNANDFLKFLKDDFSAVLTDPTASAFVLNTNCDLIGYSTIFNGCKEVGPYYLRENVPYRFAHVIDKMVDNNAIGISLLSNGDIIISKNQMIRFVKRCNKWLNFNGNAFSTALSKEKVKIKNERLIKEIFATALDVSFSHCGGIIACVDYNKLKNNENVLSMADNLIESNGNESNKRKIIRMLVGNNNFSDIDRKLRAELTALDGACIIDKEGKVISFGAIIQNESGSTGGGRGAAARALSKFGGFAIKISTDGYLELYVDGRDPVYKIK